MTGEKKREKCSNPTVEVENEDDWEDVEELEVMQPTMAVVGKHHSEGITLGGPKASSKKKGAQKKPKGVGYSTGVG